MKMKLNEIKLNENQSPLKLCEYFSVVWYNTIKKKPNSKKALYVLSFTTVKNPNNNNKILCENLVK